MSFLRSISRPAASLAALILVGCADGTTAPTAPSNSGTPNTPGDTMTPANPGANLTYRYNAKFEPPLGRVVHGLGQWADYNAKYVPLLSAAHQPASELSFIPIADTVRPWQPAKMAESYAAMEARGRIPLVNLSLFAGQPTPADLAQMSDKLFGVDDEIANSTKWDSRLLDFANVLAAHKKPILLRIGGEFNGSWNGYHAYEFPKAYRKIAAMIRAAGGDNVAFVWCYEPAGPGDFDEKNAAGEFKWYPGDDVVDWFSIDLFATHDIGGPTSGHAGLTPFGRTIKFLDMAVAQQRPVVIAESSPMAFDFATTGTQSWSAWFVPYFALIASRPEIEWFVYINYDWGKASYYANQGWKNNDLAASPALAAQYSGELAKAKYLHSGERALLRDYGKYK